MEEFISDLIDISCVGIPKMFSNYKNIPQRQSCLQDLDLYKNDLVEFVIDNLYTNKKVKNESLTFENLNKKFEDFKYLFTAGHIREFAFVYCRDRRNKENKTK
jgi:hypothetical protein